MTVSLSLEPGVVDRAAPGHGVHDTVVNHRIQKMPQLVGCHAVPLTPPHTTAVSMKPLALRQLTAASQPRTIRAVESDAMRTRPLVVLAFGLLTACGGSTSTAAPQTTTAGAGTTTVAAGQAATANATLTAEQQAALQAYRQCLRDNGGIGGGLGGRQPGQGGQPPTGGQTPADAQPPTSIDPATVTKAQEACAAQLPAGMDPTTALTAGRGQRGQGPAGQVGGFDPTALQAYTSCLTDNGVNIATPPSTTAAANQTPGQGGPRGGGAFGGLAGIDRTSPEFIAANEKCKVLLPEGFPAGGFGGRDGGGPPGADQTATTVSGPTTTKP